MQMIYGTYKKRKKEQIIKMRMSLEQESHPKNVLIQNKLVPRYSIPLTSVGIPDPKPLPKRNNKVLLFQY